MSFEEFCSNIETADTQNMIIENIVCRIRNNLTFHYDQSGKLIRRFVEKSRQLPKARSSSATRASEAHLWRFKLAEDAVNHIVVREIFKLDSSDDLETECDEILDEMHKMRLLFVDFAGELIWKFLEKYR